MFNIKRKLFAAALTAALLASALCGCRSSRGSRPPAINLYSAVSPDTRPASSQPEPSAPASPPAAVSEEISDAAPDMPPDKPSDADTSGTGSEASSGTAPEAPDIGEGGTEYLYNCSPDAPVTLTFKSDCITVKGRQSDFLNSVVCESGSGRVTEETDGDVRVFTVYPNIYGRFGLIYIKDGGGASNALRYAVTENGCVPAFTDGALSANLTVTERAAALPDDMTLRYITKDGGAENAAQVLDKIKRISDSICAGLTDDYEKLRAISGYVAGNVYYDFAAYNSGIPQECLTLENIIETSASVCGGYSNLTAALCAAQGIKCYNIKGLAVTNNNSFMQGFDGDHHEWNIAELNGRLIIIDTGWDSHNTLSAKGKYKKGNISFRYFDIGTEIFSINHKALSAEYRDYWGAAGLAAPQ